MSSDRVLTSNIIISSNAAAPLLRFHPHHRVHLLTNLPDTRIVLLPYAAWRFHRSKATNPSVRIMSDVRT